MRTTKVILSFIYYIIKALYNKYITCGMHSEISNELSTINYHHLGKTQENIIQIIAFN